MEHWSYDATQQGICYLRAAAKAVVDERYYTEFKPGTKPDKFISGEEAQSIKTLFLSTLDQFETDHSTAMFENYPAWTTRYGVEIASIDDAIQFLLYHEGLHAGVIMAMKKLLAR